MARLVAGAEALSAPPVDITAINLERILSRLERTLLSPDGDPKLRSSSFERTKVGANLQHARSLLLRLEHDSTDIRTQSKKHTVQAELQAKRELIKRLNQRLYELNQLDESEDDDSDLEEDDHDLFPSYAPARTDAFSGLDTSQAPSQANFRDAAEGLASSLRARRTHTDVVETHAPVATASTVSGSSYYANTGKAQSTAESKGATTEALLADDRLEQDDLKSSLEMMAQLLKQQAQKFNVSLQEDSTYLDQAATGLDKNTLGMGAAGQKMGTLRKMTEGKGWWARLQLYALIAGLWLLAFAIVFILPKFRF